MSTSWSRENTAKLLLRLRRRLEVRGPCMYKTMRADGHGETHLSTQRRDRNVLATFFRTSKRAHFCNTACSQTCTFRLKCAYQCSHARPGALCLPIEGHFQPCSDKHLDFSSFQNFLLLTYKLITGKWTVWYLC